jgi:cation:H+ antiporter
MLVYGISNYAKKLGISDYLIGFLVVSIGTALPEFVASINGAFLNQGEIVFGTIIGSNLFKIPLLGLVILIAGKLKINVNDIGTAPIMTFLLGILPILFVIDGNLSRIDGLILLAAYGIYVVNLWKKEGELGKIKESVKLKEILKESFIFLGALVALLLSARYLVHSSTEISNILNISPFIIGLIVIGVGASAPEVMVQVRSILKHHKGIAIGNVLGSIITNSTLVLGIVAVVKPVNITFSNILFTSIVMGVGTLYVLISIFRGTLTRKHAFIIIGGYIAALIIETLI